MTHRDTRPHVVIIGGGLAGTATALRILKDVRHPIRLSIVESRAALGLGVAYSTAHAEHLVNGLAKLFSVYDDDADHLVRWLHAASQRGGWQPPAGVALADSLPPRAVYGAYLQATLAQALAQAAARVAFHHIRARAIDVQADTAEGAPARYRITLDDGGRTVADHLVLATGVFTRPITQQGFAVDAAVAGAARYVRDIWHARAWDGVDADESVVFLGAGLSALDGLIMAEKAGFRGRHTVISRKGLAVQARQEVAPWPGFLQFDAAAPSLRALLAQIRVQRREIRRQGESWQRLVPAIRPHVPALWAAASPRERQRFLGRLRSYWESSLHRTAGQPLDWQARVEREQRYAHVAGRVRSVTLQADGRFAIAWQPRGEAARTLVADRLVNCLGFEFDWHKIDDPLVRNLVRRGLVQRGPSGFGVQATRSDHAVLDAAGRPQAGLHVVGHALRGLVWESNAISEHVPQAGAVGRAIVQALASGGVDTVREQQAVDA